METPQKRPVNYLNNKSILREIHLSKSTYCTFEHPDHQDYDLIVNQPDGSIDDWTASVLHPDNLQLAKEARAARLSIAGQPKVSPDSISTSDLVFRVMTFEHIPLSPKRPAVKPKGKKADSLFDFDDADPCELDPDLEIDDGLSDPAALVHVRVNFHPFKHFVLTDENTLRCVGKSHWKGELSSGEFCPDKGQITNNLAKMFLLLTTKYSAKFNWRGYSYVSEMRGAANLQLAYVGLRFNEARSANPFAFYTSVCKNAFRRVLDAEKRKQLVRDKLLEMNGLNSSWSRQSYGDGGGDD